MLVSKTNLTSALYLAIWLGSFMLICGSCKKYEEGPLLSIRSKKARVVGQWEYELNPNTSGINWEGNSNSGPGNPGDIIEFTKDMKYFSNGSELGTWGFDETKENIVTYVGPSERDWYIIKLKHNNLWIYSWSGQSSWIWHLKRVK